MSAEFCSDSLENSAPDLSYSTQGYVREGHYHGPDISSALHQLSGKCLVSQKQRLHLQAGLEKQMTDIHILWMHDSTIEI